MPYSGVNQWGPYTSASSDDDLPEYSPSATPQPTGDLDPPQSPSGTISSEAPPFQFSTSQMVTESFLTDVLMVESDQQGAPALTNSTQQVISGVAATALQVLNFYGGSVGVSGSKFS